MKENRVRNAAVRFWVSPQIHDTVKSIAAAEGRTASAVYRDLVEKGLAAGGYISGSQDIAAMVRKAVQDSLQSPVERLAAISAKGTQIAAASFFLAVFNGQRASPDYLKDEFNEVAAQARKMGVEYLKLSRDKSLDDFIAQSVRRMEEIQD